MDMGPPPADVQRGDAEDSEGSEGLPETFAPRGPNGAPISYNEELDSRLGEGKRIAGHCAEGGIGPRTEEARDVSNEPDEAPWMPTAGALSAHDLSLVRALAFHRSPYMVVGSQAEGSPVLFMSPAAMVDAGFTQEDWAAAGGKKVADILAALKATTKEEDLRQGLKLAEEKDVCEAVIGADEKITQWFMSRLKTEDGANTLGILVSMQSVESAEVAREQPSRSFAGRFRVSLSCQSPGNDWTIFSPYRVLCERDEKLVSTLQARQEMFCITDPALHDNPIVFVSDNFSDMTGYSREEINGINCRFLQGLQTSQEDVDVIRNALKNHTSARVCLLNYRKDETVFINQFQLSPLMHADGTLAYFIGVQLEVEDAEVYPFPNTRQTMAELLVEEELMNREMVGEA